MSILSRRALMSGGAALGATFLAGCTGTASNGGQTIDRRVARALAELDQTVPIAGALRSISHGMLVMPRVTKAGLGAGVAYGEGSLLIGDAPVDYYSVLAGSFGLQAGVQQYNSVLFFTTQAALSGFRARDGWTLGADLEVTLLNHTAAAAARIDTNTLRDPVYALVYGQRGLIVGASIEGSKYSRIIR